MAGATCLTLLLFILILKLVLLRKNYRVCGIFWLFISLSCPFEELKTRWRLPRAWHALVPPPAGPPRGSAARASATTQIIFDHVTLFYCVVQHSFFSSWFGQVFCIHCRKRLAIFPSPDGMSLAKLSLMGNTVIIPGQGEFGYSDILAGDVKIVNLSLRLPHSTLPHLLTLWYRTASMILGQIRLHIGNFQTINFVVFTSAHWDNYLRMSLE